MYKHIKHLLILLLTAAAFGCEDESPVVTRSNDFTGYLGDWQGLERYTFDNDGENIDTVALEETLRFMAGSDASGRFEILDLSQAVTQEGSFTVTIIENNEFSVENVTLLQLVTLTEDTNDNFEPDINGENVFQEIMSFNVIELSDTRLVLSDAREDGTDFVTYTYIR